MYRLGLIGALVVLIVDQWSKWLALHHLLSGPIPLIPGFFDLTLVFNLGAAFGLFSRLPPAWAVGLLSGIAIIATILLVLLLGQSRTWFNALALGLILGGAFGNLLDRVRLGKVVDFFHLHWHDLSFPVFNVADSAITLGVGLLILESIRQPGASSP